jgi:hypothetical protein
MIGGVAATAAVRTFPFRVFSFPSQPIIASPPVLTQAMLRGTVDYLKAVMAVSENCPRNMVLVMNMDQKIAWDNLARREAKWPS